MNNTKTRKIVITSLFAALTCVATLIIHIPIAATNGYINLGDCIVLLSGFMLGPVYGAASAGIGSSLADFILGYASYAPVTLIIKAVMAVIASLIYHFPDKKFIRLVFAGIIAELIMVFCYYLYESVLYGFVGAAPGIISNSIQGFAGFLSATVLIKVLSNVKEIKNWF